MNPLGPKTIGYGLAAALAMLLNTLLVLIKESDAEVKAAMKALTGHHWITHGLTLVALFLLMGYVLSRTPVARHSSGALLTALLVLATILSGFGIVGFYLLHSL